MAGSKQRRKLLNLLVIALNVVLILGLIIAFFQYDSSYKQKLYDQNVDDISNINQASASIASSFLEGREAKLRDVALYIEENELDLPQSLEYIYYSNSDEKKAFEVIGPEFKGYHIDKKTGTYTPIDYSSGYGSLGKVFNAAAEQPDSQVVGFMPEFTDACSAMTSFALYNTVRLPDETGAPVPYTLMLVSRSADFIDLINIENGYKNLSTVIINREGGYIISSSDFKSDNFFKYLATFNELTLDARKEIEAQVAATDKGALGYRDARGRACVFVYAPVPGQEWYCVTAVPVESFHNSGAEFGFAMVVVVVMLLLLATDLLYLAVLNRRLRISAENERVASVAKTDFLSRMSHDMRTPMNGIIGMTRLTQDIPGLPQEARDNLAEIEDSSAYLLQLINDTLDMNKIESNKVVLSPDTVDARELTEHIVTTIRPLADQKQIRLEVVPIHAVEDLYVKADRIRLQQIFLNILSNAVKFTPERGVIRIELECLGQEAETTHARISIRDSGCGMSAEFLQHIFEPFSQERTKITRGQEGTGLGMAIVKNLVELMGGRVEIESELGAGTTVTVYLDFARVQDAPQAAQDSRAAAAVLAGKRALLAEDHPLNATIARRLLEKKGVLVEHAEDGRQAVEMFAASAPGTYDVVLMDIRMPEMDGLQATRAIRAMERPDAKTVPILAMTANAYAEDVQAALAAGMNAHLAKPIEPEVLYRELENHL